MRTIIAGSRGLYDKKELLRALKLCGWTPTVVISGTARGVDQMGEAWAMEFGVPCEQFPANWERYGKRAGHIRNAEMADHAEALIALWDGASKGTKGMIDIARRRGLRVYVHKLWGDDDGS